MKAVIMAGGKGTRLSSVISDIPKPMVRIAGKPLLEYQIENLKDNGIREIIIVIGYLGQVIEEYFKDGQQFGVKISYFAEQVPLGTAWALYYLKETLKEAFIVLFGDVFIDIDFKKFAAYHREKGSIATLFIHPNSHPYDSDLVMTDDEGRVTGWNDKNVPRTEDYKNQVNAGIYVFEPDIAECVKKNRKTDLEKQVIASWIQSGKVYAYCSSEYVKDVGTPKRLKTVERDFMNGVCRQKNLKNKQKCIFLDRDGTINRYVGFLNRHEQMELEEHAADAIREINESEYLAIIVSNQPVLARGECTAEEMEKIHNRMYTLLGEAGAYIDGLYYCPHHPDCGFEGEVKALKINCRCRKPDIGMIKAAEADFNIDPGSSWIIGDTTTDIQTGKNAGIKTMLVQMTGEGGRDGKYAVKPDAVGNNLKQCVEYILKKDEADETAD